MSELTWTEFLGAIREAEDVAVIKPEYTDGKCVEIHTCEGRKFKIVSAIEQWEPILEPPEVYEVKE